MATPVTAVRQEEVPNLRDYMKLLWARRWLVALSVAVAAGSALAFSSRQVPVYEAEARVFIGPRTAEATDIGEVLEELNFSGEFLASYAELLKSRPLAEQVVRDERLGIAPVNLQEQIETSIITNTRIIEVRVADTDAERAQTIANAIVNTFVDEELEDFGGRAGVQASVLESALLPQQPVSPKPLRNGLLGAALGLALGVGTAFLLEQFDTTIRTPDDAEDAFSPTPVLAAVPHSDEKGSGLKLFFDLGPKHPTAEAFRILRTKLQSFGVDEPLHRVMIASPYAEEGKSTVAANLALSQSVAGSRTVLVETDLRRPVMHEYFDVAPQPGLSDVLVSTNNITEATKSTRFQNLWVVLAGRIPPNPSELIGSQSMRNVIEQLASRADMLVFDTPPALSVSDAAQLGRLCDGVILVVRAGRTHKQHARQAIDEFERNGAKVLGVVLNDVAPETADYYYSHYESAKRDEPKRGLFRRRRRGYVPTNRQAPTTPANVNLVREAASGPKGPDKAPKPSASPESGRSTSATPVTPAKKPPSPGGPTSTAGPSSTPAREVASAKGATTTPPKPKDIKGDDAPGTSKPTPTGAPDRRDVAAADVGLDSPKTDEDDWKRSSVAQDIDKLRRNIAERTGSEHSSDSSAGDPSKEGASDPEQVKEQPSGSDRESEKPSDN